MNFEALRSFLERNGCVFEPFDDAHWVTHEDGFLCIIEELPFYSVPTLLQYFYELNVPPTEELGRQFALYVKFRREIENPPRKPDRRRH